jgi:LmbE family N-acetylglucosaminyl deacetylase
VGGVAAAGARRSVAGVIRLPIDAATPLRLLLLGAHSDDIEIGCGGTILTLLQGDRQAEVCWVVFSASGARAEEARRGAAAFTEGTGARCDVRVGQFRDGFLPSDVGAVKEYFEGLKAEVSPDVIFTHRLEDRHQDHRLVAELTWNTFRDHLILEYEIPKYEGDLGHPNVFVPIEESVVRRKIALLMETFGTQRSKRWFTEDALAGLTRIRGVEAGLTGHAEAFHARKIVLTARVGSQRDPAGTSR